MSAAEVYRKTRKVPDLFWNAYVCRPVAALLVSALQGTRITPNQITLSAVFVALISVAILLCVPGHVGLIAAVVVFELSYVLDCADGMLARWRGTASPVGHLLDFLMDELKAFLTPLEAQLRSLRVRRVEDFISLNERERLREKRTGRSRPASLFLYPMLGYMAWIGVLAVVLWRTPVQKDRPYSSDM